MADELTPEEKLLKVIQQGGAPVPATAGPDSAVSAPVDTMVAPISSGTAAVGISLLKRVLTVITILLIGLVVFELYSNVPDPEQPAEAIGNPITSLEPVGDVTSIASVTGRFVDRDFQPKALLGDRNTDRDEPIALPSTVDCEDDRGREKNGSESEEYEPEEPGAYPWRTY